MAARGAESKENIFNKLQEVFEGSFMADKKTLRIPVEENGETIEIKVTLTAAKDIIGGGSAKPQVKEVKSNTSVDSNFFSKQDLEPTPQEKEHIIDLISALKKDGVKI